MTKQLRQTRRLPMALMLALLASTAQNCESFVVPAGASAASRSRTALDAAFVHSSASPDQEPRASTSTTSPTGGRQDEEASRTGRPRRWPGKIWSRLSLSSKQRRRSKQASRLQMRTFSIEEGMDQETMDFVARNFEMMEPQTALPSIAPEQTMPTVDSEFFDVSIHEAPTALDDFTVADQDMAASSAATQILQGPKEKRKVISLSGGMASLAENALTNAVRRLTAEEPVGVAISAKPRRKRMVTGLLRGHLGTDAELHFGRLVFPNLELTSGRLHIQRMTVNLLNTVRSGCGPRFPNQFDMHFDDILLTQDDLWNSSCFRNGLRRLLVRLLQDRGVQSSSIQVTSVGILPNGKVFCQGDAKTMFGSPIPFEVRTGITTKCSGHVLDFTGMEICLNRDIGFFVPVIPSIDVDIGHNARVRDIHIDGDAKELKISTSVTITPANTIQVGGYSQSNEAFAARFSVDVGRWFTNLGNWTGPRV